MSNRKISFLLVLSFCFLLGMATRKEKENVEKTVEAVADSATVKTEKGMETNYQISAATVSKVAQGDTITHVIFGETKMMVSEAKAMGVGGLEQKRADEKIWVKYPKVVMVGDKETIKKYAEALVKSIKFFDVNGKVKKEIDVQGYIPEKIGPARVGISPNNKYLRINAPVEGEKEIEKSKIVVFSAEGDSLWGFEHKLVNVYLSPNGKYMLGVPDLEWGDAPVFLYSKDGNILKEIHKENQGIDVAFSKDGGFFALIIPRINWQTNAARHIDRYFDDLIVCDERGLELWKKDSIAKGDDCGCLVKISDDDVIAVMTGNYKVYYFNKNGSLIKEEQGDLQLYRKFKEL